MQCMTFFITFLTLFGFSIHFGQNLANYLTPTRCRVISPFNDLLSFGDQSLFFMVFIWVIFKMLGIWEMMINEREEDQKRSSKRLLLYQIFFIICWLSVWSVQRYLEMKIISEEQNQETTVKAAYRWSLITFNMLELALELALYFSLVRVFCIFRKFLNSIFDQKISEKQ